LNPTPKNKPPPVERTEEAKRVEQKYYIELGAGRLFLIFS